MSKHKLIFHKSVAFVHSKRWCHVINVKQSFSLDKVENQLLQIKYCKNTVVLPWLLMLLLYIHVLIVKCTYRAHNPTSITAFSTIIIHYLLE